MVCRLLSFVLVFCIMVSALQAQEPGDWDDASTNWEEFKETLTLKKIVADLSVFALAIKKYLDEHDDLPDEFYHVDPDLVEKSKLSGVRRLDRTMCMALIHNSKNFNNDYQFLIEEKYLNEFPDLLKWVNLPLLQFFIFYPFTATIENGIVTNIDEYNYALIYEWPHASDEKNDQSNKKKGFSRLSETTIGSAEYLNDCYVLIKSESLYDPTNGRDRDGFVYVDICGNHSPIGDLEIEALNKLKKSDN